MFTAVAGLGTSSPVFDTIAAESRRLISETYRAFGQGFLPTLARPDVDVLEGLTPAVIVDQERIGADARSTVGTATDAQAMLRILVSRLGPPRVGPPRAFSLDVPTVRASGTIRVERGAGTPAGQTFGRTGGMGPRREGRGSITDFDLTQLCHESRSLREGALRVPGMSVDGRYGRIHTGCGLLDPDRPIRADGKTELRDLLDTEPPRIRVDNVNWTDEGLIPRIQRAFLAKDPEAMQPHVRAFVERAETFSACPDCGGTRLSQADRSSKIKGVNIADACAMPISDLADWVRGLEAPGVDPLLAALTQTLDSFGEIKLGHLALDRPASTLAGGESRRVRMVRHLGSAPADVTDVFDEPTIGLHPHAIQRMDDLLLRLRDKGNTVLVVEHKPATIAIADQAADLGPGAGTAGGSIGFEGTVEGLRASGTLAGRHLDDRAVLTKAVRTPTGTLVIRGASAHNLRDVDVDIPLGVLGVTAGVAGSGKSSLVHGSIPAGRGLVPIDQVPIRGSRGSNPATGTGMLDPIPRAFATACGANPALFSANSAGACPACNGAGVSCTDLATTAGVAAISAECEGRRFQASVLERQLGGRDLSEVLPMPVREAREVFGAGEALPPAARAILDRLADVGLDSLSLGPPHTTRSGGERQRLKPATHLAETGGT